VPIVVSSTGGLSIVRMACFPRGCYCPCLRQFWVTSIMVLALVLVIPVNLVS